MKKFSIFLVLLFYFVSPSQVYSHLGGGPPFVKVNNEYAVVNPFAEISPEGSSLTIAQDITKSIYLVNEPVTISVDLSRMGQFGLREDAAEKSLYRWRFYNGSNFENELKKVLEGSSVTTSFSSPGTYLVSLEMMTPIDRDYALLDTISLHVGKSKQSKPQSNQLTITSELLSEKPTEFTITSDTPVKEFFYGIDGKVKKGPSMTHTFSQEYYYDVLIARTVSTEGLIVDTGILVITDQGKLSFSLIDPAEPKQALRIITKQSFSPLILIIGTLNVIVIAAVIFFIRRRKASGKN